MRKRETSLDACLIKTHGADAKPDSHWLSDWLDGVNPKVSAIAMSLVLWVVIIAFGRLLFA